MDAVSVEGAFGGAVSLSIFSRSVSLATNCVVVIVVAKATKHTSHGERIKNYFSTKQTLLEADIVHPDISQRYYLRIIL